MNRPTCFLVAALLGTVPFVLYSQAQTPTPTPAPVQQTSPSYPKALLKMPAKQQLLWHKWIDPQTVVLLWRQRQEYVAPKGKKPPPSNKEAQAIWRKNPSAIIEETRPDWFFNYNVELRRVGQPAKVVWHQQVYFYKDMGREDDIPYGIHDVAVDSKSLVFTVTLYVSSLSLDKAQYCSLSGPPSQGDDVKDVVKREPKRLKVLRTDYGRTLYFHDGWPRNSDPKARITQSTPAVQGEWLLDVSDANGARSKWRFRNGAWKVVQPYTPASRSKPASQAKATPSPPKR